MTKFNYQIITPDEQYKLLIERWLIDDIWKDKIVLFLKHHSYFQIMLYFLKFQDKDKLFLPNTLRSDIQSMYEFDHNLRVMVFSFICEIEHSFKNNFCQVTCQKRGNIRWVDPIKYRRSGCFDKHIKPFLNQIDENKTTPEKIPHDIIRKYMQKYMDPLYPPLWNMLEVLTFGSISTIYKSLDNSTKKEIANLYSLDNSILESWIQAIVTVRNICCHHNKLYDQPIKTSIQIAKRFVSAFEWDNCRLFAILGIIHYFCHKLDIHTKFLLQLTTLIKAYPTVNTGLPTDWEGLIKWII